MSLKLEKKPPGYKPPTWGKVKTLLEELKELRQPRLDQIKAVKKARRNDWNSVVQKLPAAYRALPIVVGETEIPEMISRIAGIVGKEEPVIEVTPPSGRMADISKASKEEARLQALIMTIQDQQDRDIYRMGVDAQCAWGESWISVWEDGGYFNEDYKRKDDEKAEDYSARFRKMMTDDGVPIRVEDHDPQTIFPLWADSQRLQSVVIESEHPYFEVEDVYGYEGKLNRKGEFADWSKKTMGQAVVPEEQRAAGRDNIDVTHDTGRDTRSDVSPAGKKVKKVVFMDAHCCCVFLDGIKVETWEHGYGHVPMFYAEGKTTSDRDPAWMTQGIADVALVIAKQKVWFAAAIASNAALHGFPTAFIRNPGAGMLDPKTGRPTARAIQLAQMNILGPNEDIEFPMLNAHMGPDFIKAFEMLNEQMSDATLGGFSKALGTDMAGYALAQVRSMQMAVLGSIYAALQRQWRKIAYFLRHIVKNKLKGGVTLRGAVDETEDGDQFRPILDYRPEDCTDFAIEVHIPEGIVQDEMAERKSALEMNQAGIWSKRRVMEKTGVTDPASEVEEIAVERLMGSQMMDQMILTLAQQLMAERQMAVTQSTNTPFNQALEAAKNQVLGNGAGMPQNQPGTPQNALAGGQPMQQNPAPAAPQQGGPAAGPPAGGPGATLQAAGAPGIPGGVSGGQGLGV